MTPTEELRAKLDELDVRWWPDKYYRDTNTCWRVGDFEWRASEQKDGKLLIGCTCVKYLTPEQAIAATVGRRDTTELWPEWEQVLFANVEDEVAQDELNECVHGLLDKAATAGRSCASCTEMDNPDSYISHLQSALKWHDEHVPRPTNPRATCVVLQGEKPPEEVLFVRDEGGVTHYLPEEAGTCHLEECEHEREIPHDLPDCDVGWYTEVTHDCDECGYENADPNVRFCGGCGRKVVTE